jgi:hypothetical protein
MDLPMLALLLALAAQDASPPADAPAVVEKKEEAPKEEPKGPKIYVVDPTLVKLPAALKLTVSQTIASAIEKEGFAAITRDDVKTVLEQQADLSMLGGDADGAALAALGTAIGVQHVVATVVTQLDNDTLVQVRLIDSSKVSVLARREMRASETGGELIRAVEDCARLVMQPLFADGRATLQLAVSEEGADVLVDGKQLAVSPAPPQAVTLGMTPGWHLVTVSKKGFVSYQETIRVKNGETIEKPASLKPSIDFLKDYRAHNGLYRTLAWTTTGLTLVSAAAFAATGVMYLDRVNNLNRVVAETDKEATENNIAPGTEAAAPLEQRRADAANEIIPWSIAAPTSGVIMGVGALITSYFWIFGDNPDRYEDFEKEAGLR